MSDPSYTNPSSRALEAHTGVLTLDLVPNLAERRLDDGGLDDGGGSRDRHVRLLAGEVSVLFLFFCWRCCL